MCREGLKVLHIDRCRPTSTLISSRYIIYSQVMVVRQPKGQDGTKGFGPRGSPRERTAAVIDLMEQLIAHKAE